MGTNSSLTLNESLPAPRSPMTCQTSFSVALEAGNNNVRRSGHPLRRRGVPLASTIGAWLPRQVA